jgi:hypothetical protein
MNQPYAVIDIGAPSEGGGDEEQGSKQQRCLRTGSSVKTKEGEL